MTDELISKTDMLNIIDDERFTVDRKFERLRGLKGIEPNQGVSAYSLERYIKNGQLTIQAETMQEVESIEKIVVYEDMFRREFVEPKRGEWINLKEAKEHFKYISSLDKEQILHILDRLPTATIEPKRGEWKIQIDNGCEMNTCSVCGCRSIKQWYDSAVGTKGYNFCPYCGADMRGEG